MLEKVIRHFHPELTRTEIYKILVQRTLDDEVMGDFMFLAGLREHLDKNDRDKLEKQLAGWENEKNAKEIFLRS